MKLSRNIFFAEYGGYPEQTDDELIGDPLKELTENRVYKKMQDVELVLRFFAFRHINQWERLTLTQFLDRFLQKGNLLTEEVLSKYDEVFSEYCGQNEPAVGSFEPLCAMSERKRSSVKYKIRNFDKTT
ncbi:hypothetical protein [Gracilibacillus orientalis]|nr:hypothetical protein [Gracilibacillus orientalis]